MSRQKALLWTNVETESRHGEWFGCCRRSFSHWPRSENSSPWAFSNTRIIFCLSSSVRTLGHASASHADSSSLNSLSPLLFDMRSLSRAARGLNFTARSRASQGADMKSSPVSRCVAQPLRCPRAPRCRPHVHRSARGTILIKQVRYLEVCQSLHPHLHLEVYPCLRRSRPYVSMTA